MSVAPLHFEQVAVTLHRLQQLRYQVKSCNMVAA
jgi:hypothetical protein